MSCSPISKIITTPKFIHEKDAGRFSYVAYLWDGSSICYRWRRISPAGIPQGRN